jgi:hypothetical protein
MASAGPGDYVVILLIVGRSKASDIKLVLVREPRLVKLGFLLVRFYMTKSLFMLLFASYMRKLVLF